MCVLSPCSGPALVNVVSNDGKSAQIGAPWKLMQERFFIFFKQTQQGASLLLHGSHYQLWIKSWPWIDELGPEGECR